MNYEMHRYLFRPLSPKEEKEFRQDARDNHKPGAEINENWHPVYQDECRIINHEAE